MSSVPRDRVPGDDVSPPGYDAWRREARAFLAAGVAPNEVRWGSAQPALFACSPAGQAGDDLRIGLPRRLVELAECVACHRDADRWDALYRVMWRVVQGERALLEVATDPDVHRLLGMERAVRRATHKMHAFVRFRRVESLGSGESGEHGERYIAWFEPLQHVVERGAPFFARRFTSMRWSILTPERCAHWDRARLTFTPGVAREFAPSDDALEALWRSYYANIFNPARLRPKVMRSYMPREYWRNLPEASLIPSLTREAPRRVQAMIARVSDMRAGAVVRSAALQHVLATLDQSGASDPAHDPGARQARARADSVSSPDPYCLTIDGRCIAVGVAGFTDPTLQAPGVFYPPTAPDPEARLRYYATRFSMVEVDTTYYAFPSRATSVMWVDHTPARFQFHIKAHALLTGHPTEINRLPEWLRRELPRADANAQHIMGSAMPNELRREAWRRFLAALAPLDAAGKLGTIFLQFPRGFTPSRANAQMLREAREALGHARGAVEFRNPVWVAGPLEARTVRLLRKLQLAYTIVDAPAGTSSSMPPVVHTTMDDMAVIRLHGRRVETWERRNALVTERYRYLYDREQLDFWTTLIGIAAERLPPESTVHVV